MNIFIGSHSSELAGSIDYYEAYLLRQGHDITKLDHPLDAYDHRASILTRNLKTLKKKPRRALGPLNLFIDFWLSVKEIMPLPTDIFIGANNFDTLSAIVCRSLLRKPIHKIIYFASDFSEDRYASRLLNQVYYRIESAVVKRADLTISNTRRAAAKRSEFGLRPDHSLIVPNGVHLDHPTFPAKPLAKDRFIYVGNVTREHGLHGLLQVMRPLIKHLVIIGDGDDWDRTVRLCQELAIPHELHHQKDHQFVIRYLQQFHGIGLAPYNLESKWTYYCSPLKVNEYIACGLPVIISSVPEIAQDIAAHKLGVVYHDLDLAEIKPQLAALSLRDFHLRAQTFYQQYNHDHLYQGIPL